MSFIRLVIIVVYIGQVLGLGSRLAFVLHYTTILNSSCEAVGTLHLVLDFVSR